MNIYKVLNSQIYSLKRYSIVPIRFIDRYDIMRWRNDQIHHLRQVKPITREDQDAYFQNVVLKLFSEEKPDQILFSFLEDNICIGYGGLVHINWLDKDAEISFIMNTLLEKNNFKIFWSIYLNLIQMVAFDDLRLNKIYTIAYDIRPLLYEVLKEEGFCEEVRLKNKYFFHNSYVDIVIHAKLNFHDKIP